MHAKRWCDYLLSSLTNALQSTLIALLSIMVAHINYIIICPLKKPVWKCNQLYGTCVLVIYFQTFSLYISCPVDLLKVLFSSAFLPDCISSPACFSHSSRKKYPPTLLYNEPKWTLSPEIMLCFLVQTLFVCNTIRFYHSTDILNFICLGHTWFW